MVMGANRYVRPLDEDALFRTGAATWRSDIVTHRSLSQIAASAEWGGPEGYTPDPGAFQVEAPIATLTEEAKAEARQVLQSMLNDPSLIPNLRMLGVLQVGDIELQNGALDHDWHHDGLAGKRHGHAGDFFCITYLSEPRWDDAWGGHFEYGARSLSGTWATDGFSPEGEIHRLSPQARNTLLGWNQNPRLVHRSAPLRAQRDRITMIASVNLCPRA